MKRALLAPAGFHPILADVSDDRAATEIRADLNLTLVFEPNQLRPTKQELFSYWEKAPLSKFGLDVKPSICPMRSVPKDSGSTD